MPKRKGKRNGGKKRVTKGNQLKVWKKSYRGVDHRTVATLPVFKNYSTFMPDRLRMCFTFVDTVNFATVNGAYAEVVYRMNGPFDPRQAVSGNYPYGYDRLMTIYGHQVTVASEFSAKGMFGVANSSNNNYNGDCVVYPSGTTAGRATMEDAVALPHRKYASLMPYAEYVWNKTNCVKAKMDLMCMTGKDYQALVSEDNYASLVGALPATQFYWILGDQGFDQATARAITYRIQIKYWVEFYEPTHTNAVDSSND